MTLATPTMPKGCKQTEIGVIPVDWDVIPLPSILNFISGKAHEQFIIDNGKYISVNSKFISTDGRVKKFSNKNFCPAKKGDILMVMSDLPNGKALAKCFLVEKDNKYAVNQRICILRPQKGNSKYFYYALNRGAYFMQFDDGVQQTHLLNDVFKKCPVVVPKNSEEQTAIATALSDTDALIEKLEALIEKKKNIRQGAMQELLTGKRRLSGFSGEWKKEKLGDLLDYEQPTKYLVKSTDYNDSHDIPVLTAGKTFVLGYTDEEFGVFQNLPTIIFDDFTTAIKYVDFPFKAKSSAMKMLVPKNKEVDLRFLFSKMHLLDFKLLDHKRYWISEYQKIEIDTPKPEEQTAIATVLSDMDTEIEGLESELKKYKDIKQGMMQTLLTGKIRLIK